MACVICKGDRHGEETREVKTLGLKNLIRCSLLREDGLVEVFQNVDSIILHTVCHKRYTSCKLVSGVWVPSCGMNPRRKPSRDPVKFVFTAESNDTNSTANSNVVDGVTHGSRNNIEIKADKNNINVKVECPDNIETNHQNLLGSTVSTEQNVTNSEVHREIAYVNVNYDNTSSELKYCPLKNKDDILLSVEYEPNEDISESELLSPNYDDLTKPFPFDHLCLVCAKDIGEKYIAGEQKKPRNRRNNVCRVSRGSTKLTILKWLSQTIEPIGQVIMQRIQDVDLVQVKAGYHVKCINRVYTGLEPKGGKPFGGQLYARVSDAMDKICRYIEEVNRATYTSRELLDLLDKKEKISAATMKNRLKKRYGDKMYYTACPGLPTVFTFVRDSTSNMRDEKSGDKTLNRMGKNAKGKITTKRTLSENPKNINYENSFEDPPCSPGSDLPMEQSTSDTNTPCHICWSENRQLEGLGEYADVCWRICGDDFKVDSGQLLVCWECRASLRHALRFQQRARASTWFLNGEMERKCLSSMTVVTPALSLISCKPDKTQTQIEDDYTEENTDIDTKNIENLVKEEIETYSEEHVDGDVPQASDDGEREMDGFASGDDGVCYDPPRTRRATKKSNDKKSTETYPEAHVVEDVPQASNDDERETDYFAFSDDDRPLAPKRSRKSKKKITDRTSRGSNDDGCSSSASEKNDPDWDEYQIPITKKPAAKKTTTAYHRYKQRCCGVKTMDDGDFDADSLIEVVRIEPQEINEWREKERDSTYFRGLQKKCETCITVIEEDHDTLYHCLDSAHVCSVCSARCRTAAELDSHLAAHCSLYRCAVCRYQCCARAHTTAHVHLHRRIYQCLECGHGLRSLDVLKEHFNELHRFSVCDHCGKQFPHKLHLEKHIQRAHAPPICTKCNKEFKKYSSFKHHMDLKHHISRTELAYCVQCDIQFDNRRQMKLHLYNSRNHVNENKRGPRKTRKPKQKEEHKCPACQKVYANKYSMREHYRYEHTKEITYHCQHCNKSYPRKNAYIRHMKLRHQGYKPPKDKICDFCGRGFTTKKILVHHVRTHTGERPFACEHCPAAFAQRIALRTHVKHIHLGLKRGGAGAAQSVSAPAPSSGEQSYPA